jgi:hypothetical protein
MKITVTVTDNNNQRDLQERIKNANKTYFMLQQFLEIKIYLKKLKFRLKNTIIDQTLTYASETGTLTQRERKQLNTFERKIYRRILGPVYDNEKENWRILTNEEIYARVKKTYYNRDNKVKIDYVGLGLYREWKEIEFPKGYYI